MTSSRPHTRGQSIIAPSFTSWIAVFASHGARAHDSSKLIRLIEYSSLDVLDFLTNEFITISSSSVRLFLYLHSKIIGYGRRKIYGVPVTLFLYHSEARNSIAILRRYWIITCAQFLPWNDTLCPAVDAGDMHRWTSLGALFDSADERYHTDDSQLEPILSWAGSLFALHNLVTCFSAYV